MQIHHLGSNRLRIHILSFAVVMLFCTQVFAAGFEQNSNGAVALGRGGAFTAKADDLVAFEYNPAGLLKNKGTLIYLTGNLTNFQLDYEPIQIGKDGNQMDVLGTSNEGGLFVAPFFAVSSDILGDDWRIGLGVFGPNAVGKTNFPMDDENMKAYPHRYMMLGTDMMMVFYSAAVAWQPYKEWGVGVTLHWVDMNYAKIKMHVNGFYNPMDNPPPPCDPADKLCFAPEDASNDVEARINVADHFNFAATIGTWLRPISNLEIGLSARIPPVPINASGDMELDFKGSMIHNMYQSGIETGQGLVPYDNDGNQIKKIPVSLKMNLPMVARLGVRYFQPLGEDDEVFDVEADVVWEGWSTMESYRVDIDGYMQLTGSGVSEAKKLAFNPVVMEKNFQDTWSFRLGGDVRVLDWLRVRWGGYYETGAVPEAYTNLDFASYDRFGTSAGLTFKVAGMADLSLGYSRIYQSPREVSVEETRVYQQVPLVEGELVDRFKVGAGTYETAYDIFSLSALIRL